MNLRDRADRIPCLGEGGRTCGDRLIDLASKVPAGQAIVDVAPWLGSTTAYLALGIIRSGNGCALHAFDRWIVDAEYKKKAARYHHMNLDLGRNLLPAWEKNVKPFGVSLYPHRGDIREAVWSGIPVGLMVDDISNTAELIESTMRIFSPWIVTGGKLVLLDYGFCETKRLTAQRDWMARHGGAYKLVERCKDSPAAVFVRLAGSIG